MRRLSSPLGRPSRPRVALLIETSSAFGRELLVGIAQYLRGHELWSIELHEGELPQAVPAWFNRWEGHGVIARVATRSVAKAVARLGVPSVDLLGGVADVKMPLIRSNDARVARLAAQHLLERGFRFFAFCGFNGVAWSDSRANGFRRCIAEAGFPFRMFPNERPSDGMAAGEPRENGERCEQGLLQWLETLPKPVGLMACNDVRGRQVIRACGELGLAVPDDVAVIGVDNDEVMSAFAEVPLSSVILNSRRIGYEAAALLDRMMAGEKPPRQGILMDPIGVAACRSTDAISVGDHNLAKAMSFIQAHCGEEITNDSVAAFAGLSRSALQRRFRAVLRETVHHAIVRLRLKRARDLLLRTSLPLKEIADESGFKSAAYLGVVFNSCFGKTPAQFRKEFQRLSAASYIDLQQILAERSLEDRCLRKLSPVTPETTGGGLGLLSELAVAR